MACRPQDVHRVFNIWCAVGSGPQSGGPVKLSGFCCRDYLELESGSEFVGRPGLLAFSMPACKLSWWSFAGRCRLFAVA